MIGRTISHYQITERLGAGGMGEIYKAQDQRLNRVVAIKVLTAPQSGTDDRRRRFLQEAQAASALNHPNIVTIHDIVSEGETEFLVMEFIAGKTLGELIPKGGLPMSLVLAYAVQIADGLEAAHGAGIVHRDLKPGNIMITGQSSEGRPGLVKLLDFGLAKLTALHSATSLTDETATVAKALTIEGSIIGTLSYMSPEQAEGKPVDARSDIFAFGAILHEMVTGERAFSGDSTVSTLTSILRDEVRPMTQMATGVPPALESIVGRCLQKNREERWQTIGDVRAALARLKRDSESGMLLVRPAAPPSQVAPPPPPPPPPKKKIPVFVALLASVGALAVLAVLGLVFGIWLLARHSSNSHSARNRHAASVASVPSKTDDGVLTNQSILEMVNADVATRIILEQIRSSKTRFDLSTSEIIRLTEEDVPAEVIEAMRKAARTESASPVAGAKAPPPAPVRAPAAVPAPSANPTPPVEAPAPPVVPATAMVTVLDRLPITIRLAENVPADVPAGAPVHFTVAHDFRMRGAVVVAEGAVVTGEIVEAEHRKLIHRSQVMFRLKDVDTTGGGKLALRANMRSDEDGRRNMETSLGNTRHSKDLAAPAGAEYLAFIDGDQTVPVKK